MITIIGGTYDEWCLHPPFEEKNGSGLRACYAINSLDKNTQIDFHTYSSEKTSKVLEYLESIYKFKITKHLSKNDISFEYDYPLRKPVINPRPDLIIKPKNEIYVEADNILYFGMLEGNAVAKGKKAVYDPQSPVKPIPFHKTKSTAAELAVVINIKEARQIVKSDKLETIKKYFFEKDNAAVLVIKMGPKGAMVFLNTGESIVIPVYKTSYVWPIGSGDVFASVFAYYWMENGKSAFEAAKKASFSTAIYCNSRNYGFTYKKSAENIEALNIKEYPKGKVYLAGPFFTYAQKWLINELRDSLLGLGLNVFSPWHDVGEGSVEDGVAEKDIDALKECKIVFAVVDGFDSGTIFEIGYAVKQDIPVIAYVENESKPSLTMLTGTKCHIEKDMTTALYKCLWILAENEQSNIIIGGN
jgi:nucleoside 2-deoxyribosyltransferase